MYLLLVPLLFVYIKLYGGTLESDVGSGPVKILCCSKFKILDDVPFFIRTMKVDLLIFKRVSVTKGHSIEQRFCIFISEFFKNIYLGMIRIGTVRWLAVGHWKILYVCPATFCAIRDTHLNTLKIKTHGQTHLRKFLLFMQSKKNNTNLFFFSQF